MMIVTARQHNLFEEQAKQDQTPCTASKLSEPLPQRYGYGFPAGLNMATCTHTCDYNPHKTLNLCVSNLRLLPPNSFTMNVSSVTDAANEWTPAEIDVCSQ